RGAHQATLDPIAARRPDAGQYMWSEQGSGRGHVGSGAPAGWGWGNTSAAALLSYDIPHKAPWGWEVGLYTWTKGIAAGAYLVAVILGLAGSLSWSGPLMTWAAPLASGVFLAVTGLILVLDLTHPARFLLIFRRPQWKSWLVRGAVVLTAYGVILGVHLLSGFVGSEPLRKATAVLGVPLGAMTAIYTAYLFAQSKGRDLWQSPLLPPHLLVQAVLAGAATLLLLAALLESEALRPLSLLLAAACGTHLLMVVGEITLPHGSAHARLAVWELTRGRFRRFFWAGAALVALGLAAPFVGAWASPLALAGLLAYEHAYVQAGQVVPLA
ncbi:MAG: NrfD/PsrC family molybdoenzyme membrane anchor subunit, partial [Gemmatimonadales bacterium]